MDTSNRQRNTLFFWILVALLLLLPSVDSADDLLPNSNHQFHHHSNYTTTTIPSLDDLQPQACNRFSGKGCIIKQENKTYHSKGMRNHAITTTTTTTNNNNNLRDQTRTSLSHQYHPYWEHNQQQQQQQQQHQQQQQRILQTNHNPRFGKIKVLVLLIQFMDHQEDRTLVNRSVVEGLFNGQIKEWFAANAGDKYQIEPVVMDWILTDQDETTYADGKSGFGPSLKKAMFPALNQIDTADPNWNWTDFDRNMDGRLDSVVMIHSGISAILGGVDCFGKQAQDRIFPHGFSSGSRSDTWFNQNKTVMLNGYTVTSVYDNKCDDIPMRIGLLLHEYMHTMNMVDLYPYDFSGKGVGFWDVMGHPYGADNSGTPGLLGAYMRKEVGWLDPTNIVADGVYTCKPAHNNSEAYMINLTQPGAPAPEYLLIENRQPIGFDSSIGGAGLLIWHIDDAANGMENKGFPGQPGWPQNGNHYMVAVLPKDGQYDLENNINLGDAGDLFGPGDVLGPGMNSTVFPNTDSYQGGKITESGILIKVISQESNGDIKFSVAGVGQTKESSSNPNNNPTPNVTPEEPDSPPSDFSDATQIFSAEGRQQSGSILPRTLWSVSSVLVTTFCIALH